MTSAGQETQGLIPQSGCPDVKRIVDGLGVHFRGARALGIVPLVLALHTLLGQSPAQAVATPGESEAYLVLGMRQATEGDFEAAVFSLDTAVRRLTSRPEAKAELAQAYLWLGATYVGLDHMSAGKAKFRRALALDPRLEASASEFPANVTRAFEEVRQERTASQRGKQAKIALLGGAGVATGAVVLAVAKGGHAPSNRAPVPAIQFSPGGQLIVDVTEAVFTASAADPDGDPMTYAWQLGDGTTEAGAEVRHVFHSTGSFAVALTATDTSGASASATIDVTVRSLSGVWCLVGCQPDHREFQCTQSGRALDCPWIGGEGADEACLLSWRGEISSPRQLALVLDYCGWDERGRPYIAEADSDLETIFGIGALGDYREGFNRKSP